ncbi:type 1 phosphatases regulator ypi1 [Xylogone sp. PMI_703]|nr:type 1 phosphatases regulator ypi1 [Xylogone sp. PMI_703]
MTTVQRAPPASGSQSQIESSPRIVSTAPRQAVLHLRGARRTSEDDGEPSSGSNRRRIRWAEDVVDNEGLGRKSSKVCCIYHAPRPIDESSDESSSSSDSDSDSGDDGSARPSRKEKCGHNHNHDHGKDKASRKRRPSPNAYEKVPKNRGVGGTTLKQ